MYVIYEYVYNELDVTFVNIFTLKIGTPNKNMPKGGKWLDNNSMELNFWFTSIDRSFRQTNQYGNIDFKWAVRSDGLIQNRTYSHAELPIET